jgi:hypothetical protein
LNFLAFALGLLALAVLGVFLLHAALWPSAATLPGPLQDALNRLPSDAELRWTAGLLGTVFCALVLKVLLSRLRLRLWERGVLLQQPHGEVLVSLAALEEIGRQAQADVKGIKELHLKVRPRRRGLHASAKVLLYSDANLSKTTRDLQDSLRQRLTAVLGSHHTIRPQVLVSKVVERQGEAGKGRRPRRAH